MVGVPGRSKGCHTCKQRRIRCNGERPQCSNCIKSKRACGGYLRTCAFILSQDMLAFEPALSQTISDNSEYGDLMVARWRVDPTKPSQPSQRTAKLKITMPDHRHQHSTNRLPWKVSSQHAGLQQILEIFLTNHLPSEELDRTRPITKRRNWLLEIQDVPILTPALESSILAVCLARLGRKHNNEALVCEGFSMYTRGLSQLRQAVRDPRARRDDETLATCLALLMFESNECPARSIESCMAHYRGAMNLLLLRAPEAYASGMAHFMFLQLRMLSVFQGMQMHSRTFLADNQWRDVPFKSSQKGLRDLLIDILLEMPEIYHRHDKLNRETCRSEMLPSLINIAELCWQIDSQLNEWYRDFETFVAGPVYWPKLSTSDSPVDDVESGRVFPVAFDFPSYDVAQVMILYWLSLLLLHPILCHMYERLESFVGVELSEMECSCIKYPTSKTTDLAVAMPSICLRHVAMDKVPPLGYRTEWARGAARNICQSAEYFMQEKLGELGPFIFLPRLLIVREFLVFASGDWTRELSWINNVMRKIQDMGHDITRYL